MKKLIFVAGMIVSFAAAAQEGYEFIRYRANDPFVFCTQGQRTPDKCWWPVTPYMGQYVMNPACDPPDPYGKPWTAADTDSLSQYLEVCPQAITSGSWKGTTPPEMTPFAH